MTNKKMLQFFVYTYNLNNYKSYKHAMLKYIYVSYNKIFSIFSAFRIVISKRCITEWYKMN